MQQNLERALQRMVDAWDAGDPGRYAAEFTADATYVTFLGSVSRGRDQIERDHVDVLQKWQRGSRMRMEIRSVRMLDDDTAIVVAEGGVGKKRTIALDKVQTFVFRRDGDGRWSCAAFQNTKKKALALWVLRLADRRAKR
ncbi:MAG: SgcJ/EcaC family oxidoreductase [Rhodococcus sp.]|uniref:SgcJ/EcaC family oxidoreductase n=1 Tax=Rhodococcus TaxID=1827 RepID=UPI0016A71367|nr:MULTISPECIES: SgcJ/EcaC family oxidoreductase [Rhodococcus]NLV80030.1 SgcJ/EcaC family oxidoreductase [Rhodococcus sp. (in: high G+C Gram-positive bacteria)]